MLGVWLSVSMRFVSTSVNSCPLPQEARWPSPAGRLPFPHRRCVMAYRSAQSSRHFVRMVPYAQNENDGGHLQLCAVCDAVVAGWAEGNTACATCGMTVIEPPVLRQCLKTIVQLSADPCLHANKSRLLRSRHAALGHCRPLYPATPHRVTTRLLGRNQCRTGKNHRPPPRSLQR